MRQTATAEVRLDEGKAMSSSTARRATQRFGFEQRRCNRIYFAARLDETENHAQQPGDLGNVGLADLDTIDAALLASGGDPVKRVKSPQVEMVLRQVLGTGLMGKGDDERRIA